MKNIKFIFLFGIVLFHLSCKKNPFSDLERGDWNHERNVLDIQFENQVGKAVITRIDDANGLINITINADAVSDLKNIKLAKMETSYKAESSIKVGDVMNFENSDKSASLKITSPAGESRDYIIRLEEFSESLIGTYDITGLALFGGTGPEYGGGGLMQLIDKPWIWPANDGPRVELDNTLRFELTGITEEGNTYGKVYNDAGPDGLYANFLYILDPQTDVNNFYRKIPKVEGEWTRNYTNGTITFKSLDGKTSTGVFLEHMTEDLGNGFSKTIENQAFAFSLNGTDDWDKIYSDYDKFVKKPRRYWIEVKKND